MDPTQLIKRDHQEIERLFRRIERAIAVGDSGETDAALRDIVRELSVHAAIEEQFLYPALRGTGSDDDVLDAVEEHHAVKLTLSELQVTPASDERFRSKVRLLLANVREHIEQEERELLPVLERVYEPGPLRELAGALENAKRLSPTRPHPSAPEAPPGNLVLGPLVGVADRFQDSIRDNLIEMRRYTVSAAEAAVIMLRRLSSQAERRGREAVGDLAARTRIATDEAREAGRRTLEEAAGRGAEAARQLRSRATRSARRGRNRRHAARRGA